MYLLSLHVPEHRKRVDKFRIHPEVSGKLMVIISITFPILVRFSRVEWQANKESRSTDIGGHNKWFSRVAIERHEYTWA